MLRTIAPRLPSVRSDLMVSSSVEPLALNVTTNLLLVCSKSIRFTTATMRFESITIEGKEASEKSLSRLNSSRVNSASLKGRPFSWSDM